MPDSSLSVYCLILFSNYCITCYYIRCICTSIINWILKFSVASGFACRYHQTKTTGTSHLCCLVWLPWHTSPKHFLIGLQHFTQPEASWTFAIRMVTGTTLAFASRQHWSCRHHIWLQSISCAAVNLTRLKDLYFFKSPNLTVTRFA